MGTIQLGRWHEGRGFVSDEESRTAVAEQDDEEYEDLPLYDGAAAEALVAADIEDLATVPFTTHSRFTGLRFLAQEYRSDEPRVSVPRMPAPRKSIKQMRQEIQALHGDKPFREEDKPLMRKLGLLPTD